MNVKGTQGSVGSALLLALGMLAVCGPAGAGKVERTKKVELLRIGTSGNLTDAANGKELGALLMQAFIKTETGFENEIRVQKDWTELAAELVAGNFHVGIFQGYEFAWAKEKNPELQPLVLAVNVHVYRQVYLVVRRDSRAKDVTSLKGRALALPRCDPGYLQLFLERQPALAGKPLGEFFARVSSPGNAEDALDDVVDGTVQGAVVERVALECYNRRKPGRAQQLEQLLHSAPLPPPLLAYHEKLLDDGIRKQFRDSLIQVRRNERGAKLLSLFKLTGFETVPNDLDRLLGDVRKKYPAPRDAE